MSDFDAWGGDWTAKKITTLRTYLRLYQTALKNTGFHRSYIDALAGDGTWRQRVQEGSSQQSLEILEQEAVSSFREGSAKTALGIEPPFDRYVFNDLDSEKTKRLYKVASDHGVPLTSVDVCTMDANEFIQTTCRSIDRKTQGGVVLLDPWGMQVNWTTVQSIAATECLDMWYLFPTQGVLRMLPHAGRPSQSWQDKLDSILGTKDWREEFYKSVSVVGDLFSSGPVEKTHREASFEGVEAYLIRRLRETFRGAVLENPLRLGPRNRPLFSFCFATANPSERAKGLADKLSRAVLRANK